MTDAMFGRENEHWVCPNDRQLALRAKLHTGWSFHTFQSERQRKAQTLEKRELDLIMSVIHRAEQLEIIEQHRIGRLVERLENMRRSAVGNGLSQCLLCGEVFGLLSSPSVLCLDCCMVQTGLNLLNMMLSILHTHSHSLLFASTLSHFHVVRIYGLMQ
uniref:Double C2-like domains, beta n=1 Tax=Cyprinus carpio carpio TaxID=630221 RepID=A0A9J8CAV9_CYPCA